MIMYANVITLCQLNYIITISPIGGEMVVLKGLIFNNFYFERI